MSAQIQGLPDGPLKLQGEFKVILADGTQAETKETVYLCRCGHSSKKPFCDGSHKAQGFKAD